MGSTLAPDNLNVLSNNYQDPEDPAYTQWAIAGYCGASDGNLVIPYIYGEDAFTDMGKDIARARSADDFVYLVGFETSVSVPLDGITLKDHLTRAAGAGVAIRGVFNGDGVRRALNMGIKDNKPLHDLINALGGTSYLDDHVAINGAHHQKIFVTQSASGLVGYCGGVDVCTPRESRTGWHDVHCRIMGPAAYDLYVTFRERWIHNANVSAVTLKAPMQQAAVGGNVVTYTVQIGRTYPGGPSLPWGPNQETTAFGMILNAIRKSTKFIYVEDQFLVCNHAAFVGALKARLQAPSFKFLVMMTLSTASADGSLQGQAGPRRKALLDELRSVAPDKVIACVRRDLYVHAKTWIFDDKFAIIGSANMNNRGYFHDTEVVAGIADKNEGGTRLWFAHRLRMALWMKHLDITEKEALDPEQCVDKWKATTAKVEPLNPTGTTSLADDVTWSTLIDPT